MILATPPAAVDVEERTREIGREIFAGIDRGGPSFFRLLWWDERVMDWAMADEALKVQMFRFVDVLPMLPTPHDIAEHIQAYFARGEGLENLSGKVPWPLRWGAKLAVPGTLFGNLAAWIARTNATRMAGRFIAGATPPEVLAAVEKMRAKKMAFTLDLLGEATVTEPEADAYLKQYLELLETLGPAAKSWDEAPVLDRGPDGPIPRVNLSIKVSALNSQFDPIDPAGSFGVVAGRLRQVFRAAKKHGALINLDMEQYSYKDLTLEIFRRLLKEPEFRDWPDVGLAIQAYVPETERDLLDLLEWVQRRGTPVWVRLVKGAYWDYETVIARQLGWPIPLFTQKWQSDACFERCATILMENYQWLRPALASHNVRSMAYGLALAERLEIPKSAYELQMLYGMADPMKKVFVKRGERLRIYTPFGKLLPGMAYLVRRLLENTSNASFLRATFVEKAAIESLLATPGPNLKDLEHRELESMPSQTAANETIPPFVNEPLSDFSRAINRERMQRALHQVRGEFGKEFPLYIGSKPFTTGQWIEARNPADRAQVLGKVASAKLTHVDEAVALGKKAFHGWRATPVWRRCEALIELARKLREERFRLSAWMVYEEGKQWREADADVAEAIDFCEYYARGMLELTAPRTRNLPGEENAYFYTPRGVTVVIAPWNFPLAILCGMATAPLVAGNPVILKPAEQSSIIGALFADLIRQLNLPEGVCSFVPGVGEEIGPRLVENPDVSTITFTGSVPVGTAINQSAARQGHGQTQVKRVLAEMGGKNAIIIDDDADLDEAVRGVVHSAFGYQGQKCSACSRVIVLPRVYDTFVARLKDAVASLTIGPAEDPSFALGAVIDRDAFDRLHKAVAQAKLESTLLVAVDPGSQAEKGNFIGPHVFVDVKPDAMLAQTELFGPVLAVIRAGNLDEALDIANGTAYALTGGCFSRNPATLSRVKQDFLIGNLYLNRKITGALVDCQPFGGFKLSGIGAKAGGPDYLKQFLVPRTVTENTLRRGFAPDAAG